MGFIDTNKITDVEIENVSFNDFPDFCDSYIIRAVNADTGEELNEEELEEIPHEFVQSYIHENQLYL